MILIEAWFHLEVRMVHDFANIRVINFVVENTRSHHKHNVFRFFQDHADFIQKSFCVVQLLLEIVGNVGLCIFHLVHYLIEVFVELRPSSTLYMIGKPNHALICVDESVHKTFHPEGRIRTKECGFP